jgi:hypothetical protein
VSIVKIEKSSRSFQKEKVKNWCFIRRSKISDSWVCAGCGHAGGNAAPTAARALFARRNPGGEDG